MVDGPAQKGLDISCRDFFIKDKVESGKEEIQHHPTEKMWSSVLKWLKQGNGFRIDRAVLMNCWVDYDDDVAREKLNPILIPKFD